ncbi:MAG: hypothetical protein PHE47_08750 [Oscillospiraceae bacterium]|nr:hypothetical protein [Oscillospiraceae bacterium]
MLTNGCATLYNRWEENGAERCSRVLLPAVFWESAEEGGFAGRRYSKKGQESLCTVRVLVPGGKLPAGRTYLPPKQWRALPAAEKEIYFTFQIGDVLAAGNCPFQWGEQNPLRELVRQYDQTASLRLCRSVVTPRGFSHWELEGI